MIPSYDAPTASVVIAVTIGHGRANLTLTGQVDISNAGELLMSTHWYLGDPQINHVTVDLHALTFIDASGLRTLVLSRQHADRLGKTFLIKNHRAHIADFISILGLDKHPTHPARPLT